MQRVTVICLLFCGHMAFAMKLMTTNTDMEAMKAKGDSEIFVRNPFDDDDENDLGSAIASSRE